MAAKNVDIKINTTASGNGAKQTAADMDKLAASSTKAAAATNTVTASSSKLGQRAGAVGLQIQDIAVQAQSGTNAVTILAQQGSQIASIFGPQGAIIGSIIALGAVAAQTFFKIGSDAESATKKAEFLAEAIDEVAKEAGKIKSEEIDMGRTAISEAIGLSKLLAEGFKAASDQEREFSANALKSLNELKLAELELRKSRGEITEEKAAQEQRQIAQDQILQQAEEQKKAEAARIAEAQKAEEIARDELNLRARNLVEQQRMLDVTIQEVEALRQRKTELEKIAKQTAMVGGGGALGVAPRVTPTDAARAARQELASTPFDARIKALEADVEALAKETSGNLQKDLADAAKALLEAQLAVQNISSLVTGQVEQIDLAAQKEIVIETTTQLESQAKANSDLLKKTFENIQPINEAQQQGLLMIDQVTADGLLLAEETGKARSAMQLVLSSATTAQQINLASVNRLLTLMNDYTAELSKQQKQIDNLEAKFKSIPSSPIK
jgi:hypothetical protein